MNITGGISANVNVLETLALGFNTQQYTDQILPSYSFTNGTGSGQFDLHWELPAVTLASGASVTYTLSALTDLLGRSVALVKVRALLIQVTSRLPANFLTVGGAAVHAWTALPTFVVWDMALFVAGQTDGYAVASGTSDQLKILNSGAASMTFAIAAIGTSV